MYAIVSFVIQIALTLTSAVLLSKYLQPFLRNILIDLCGTEDRARFWTAFSNILLIGLPVIFALNYRPGARTTEELFFDVAAKLSGNLGGFFVALIGIGLMVSFFALVARKPSEARPG